MNQEYKTASSNLTKNMPEQLAQKLQLTLNQTVEDIGVPGVTASVITPEGKWTGASGVSNLETQQPMQPDDIMRIASTSKAFTGATLLKLQEEGKLSLDDTIDKWLPEIADRITDGDNLTIRQLLNGSGGLFDYVNNEPFQSEAIADFLAGSTRDWQPEDLVAYAYGQPRFSGGASTDRWTYTNTGDVIAALIAEKATGQPFNRLLQERILEPLGLDRTFFSREEVNTNELVRGYLDLVTADGSFGQDGILDDLSGINTDMFFANGSITSNAANVAEFFHQLSRGEVLQPESTAQLFDFVSTGAVAGDTTANQVADGGFYGLGVTADLFPWGETRSAGGSIPGYRSDVNYFPGDDTTIAVLTNGSSEFDDLLKFGLFTRAFSAALANTLELADTSAINGTENDDLLTGTRESDIINGLEGNDTLLGEDGVDALDGGRGNDSLNGGKDRDVLFGKEGNDLLDGGEDNDLINGGIGNDDLKGSTGADSLLGSQGDDRLDGGEDNDLLDGGAGSDRLTDTRGNNSLYGNDGDDFLFTGMGDDRLAGDEGNDRLEANSGNDRLFGNEGDDFLNGGEDNDSLLGGSGNDALVGLSGNDTFTGGDGSDRFVLQPGAIATIADFTDGQDLLELSTGLTYADLNIMQGQGDNASDTLITLNENDEILAILTGVNAGAIAPTDFAMT